MSLNCDPSASSRARCRRASASRTSPRSASAHASPERPRTSSSTDPAAPMSARACLKVSIDSSYRRASERASARASVGLDAVADIRGDTGREERRIDTEPRCQPGGGLHRRACLAALDLADVLLREPVARELGLCQPGREAQRAQPLTEPVPARADPTRQPSRRQAQCPGPSAPRQAEPSLRFHPTSAALYSTRRSTRRLPRTGEPPHRIRDQGMK